MKSINKPISYRLLVFSILIFFPVFSPTKALALSNNAADVAQQHFNVAISALNWNIASGGNGYNLN